MTVYTQYQLGNPTSAQLDVLTKLGQKYSFRSEFNGAYRTLTILTTDTSLITLIDSKNVTGIVKTIVTIPEYDDTLTVAQVETLIQNKSDTSNVRPELLAKAQSNLSQAV